MMVATLALLSSLEEKNDGGHPCPSSLEEKMMVATLVLPSSLEENFSLEEKNDGGHPCPSFISF